MRTYKLIGIEDIIIYIFAVIDFPGSTSTYKTTNSKEFRYSPHEYTDAFRVKDLVELAKEDIKEASKLGMVFEVSILWDCDLDRDKCKWQVLVSKVEMGQHVLKHTKIPAEYHQTRTFHYREGDVEYRDYSSIVGFRFIFNCKGVGKKISFFKLMQRFAILIFFLGIASVLTDMFMTKFLKIEQRQIYTKAKYKFTSDFSDMTEALDTIKDNRNDMFKNVEQQQNIACKQTERALNFVYLYISVRQTLRQICCSLEARTSRLHLRGSWGSALQSMSY
eukprot:TRINITY_DN1348_c0_g2_i2.p2 TRINITY_DN1348_c0_g2~~TRINITY_DN1348_c0_g2_i2.p2  ORF type:complete len:277 (-),score=34.24 TRINITY_DN1348_c0_g2_i2:521-1351(-)